jgi:polyhydroxybutyrate depolymerase
VIALPFAAATLGVLFLHLLNPVFFGATDRKSGSIVSGGRTREYLLHVPASYDHTRRNPLVISLHGAALSPAAQMEISRWNEVADRDGFLVVYPSGIRIRPLPIVPSLPVWPMKSEAARTADVRFLSDLIDTLQPAYNIDPARIYVTGFSNGGGMAVVASCALSSRIAAVGTIAAAQELPLTWCRDSRPMPLIAFHGTADRLVSYGGRGSFPGVRQWIGSWARRNGCGPDPVTAAEAPDVERLEFGNCSEDASVVLYTIRGGGHTWPGGGPMPRWLVGTTSRSVDATVFMWSFFREHRLSRP